MNKKPLINVKRPTSELELPKPAPGPTEVERSIYRGHTEASAPLNILGKRLAKDGMLYLGSVAIHYYVHKLGPECYNIVQVAIPDPTKLPENVANMGVKALSRRMMEDLYKHKAPRKRAHVEAKETES